jgi:hypothetical protein
VGAREDWRYARMASRLGRPLWAIVSFFAVGITQQLMLVGITLPLLAIHNSAAPWNPVVDAAIFLAAATGACTRMAVQALVRVSRNVEVAFSYQHRVIQTRFTIVPQAS